MLKWKVEKSLKQDSKPDGAEAALVFKEDVCRVGGDGIASRIRSATPVPTQCESSTRKKSVTFASEDVIFELSECEGDATADDVDDPASSCLMEKEDEHEVVLDDSDDVDTDAGVTEMDAGIIEMDNDLKMQTEPSADEVVLVEQQIGADLHDGKQNAQELSDICISESQTQLCAENEPIIDADFPQADKCAPKKVYEYCANQNKECSQLESYILDVPVQAPIVKPELSTIKMNCNNEVHEENEHTRTSLSRFTTFKSSRSSKCAEQNSQSSDNTSNILNDKEHDPIENNTDEIDNNDVLTDDSSPSSTLKSTHQKNKSLRLTNHDRMSVSVRTLTPGQNIQLNTKTIINQSRRSPDLYINELYSTNRLYANDAIGQRHAFGKVSQSSRSHEPFHPVHDQDNQALGEHQRHLELSAQHHIDLQPTVIIVNPSKSNSSSRRNRTFLSESLSDTYHHCTRERAPVELHLKRCVTVVPNSLTCNCNDSDIGSMSTEEGGASNRSKVNRSQGRCRTRRGSDRRDPSSYTTDTNGQDSSSGIVSDDHQQAGSSSYTSPLEDSFSRSSATSHDLHITATPQQVHHQQQQQWQHNAHQPHRNYLPTSDRTRSFTPDSISRGLSTPNGFGGLHHGRVTPANCGDSADDEADDVSPRFPEQRTRHCTRKKQSYNQTASENALAQQQQQQQQQQQLTTFYQQTMYNQRFTTAEVHSYNLEDTARMVQTRPRRRGRAINYFEILPPDIVMKIFSHLPSDQLCRCASTCTRWYEIAWQPFLWTTIRINNPLLNVDRALRLLATRLSYDTPHVCVMVERINLNGSVRLTDRGLKIIAKRCPELRHLEIHGCSQVSNIALFEVASKCVNLEHLNVAGCSCVTCICLTPEATVQATAYGKQIYIRYLDMTDCHLLEDSGLQIIASYCSHLVYLYLRRCKRVTDLGVQYVANYCVTLKELSTSDCSSVTDFGLRELSKLEDNLRYLSVAKCEKVSDIGVIYIAQYCRKLRYLNVRGCEAVSDESLQEIAARCPRLRSLDVGKCDITDAGLRILAEKCPHLKKLSIKACEGVTDAGVMDLAYKCRSLQQLNVQECHLHIETFRTIKKYCKRCIIEHTNPGFY